MAVDVKLGARANSKRQEEKPKAKVWLNPGVEYEVERQNPETGAMETVTEFVSIPMGLPIDTMDKVKVPTKAGPFQEIQQGKNALIDQLTELGLQLKPGETINVNLTCQLRRVEEEAEQTPDASSAVMGAISKLKVA